MSDKIELMKLMMNRASERKEFIAYFLKRYGDIEMKSNEQLIVELKCSDVDYYNFALCMAPNLDEPNSIARLNELSEYTRIPPESIRNIMKHVEGITRFNEISGNRMLMAARDKHKKKSDTGD